MFSVTCLILVLNWLLLICRLSCWLALYICTLSFSWFHPALYPSLSHTGIIIISCLCFLVIDPRCILSSSCLKLPFKPNRYFSCLPISCSRLFSAFFLLFHWFFFTSIYGSLSRFGFVWFDSFPLIFFPIFNLNFLNFPFVYFLGSAISLFYPVFSVSLDLDLFFPILFPLYVFVFLCFYLLGIWFSVFILSIFTVM